MIIITDDLCLHNLEYFKYWDIVKAKYSNLRLIAFTIANYKHMENLNSSTKFKNWYDERKDWVEIGVHGYDHNSPPEQERDNAEELVNMSIQILKPFLPERFLYRPPGFQRSVRTEPMLVRLGVAGIAYQTKIKYFEEKKIVRNIFNTHCCDNFSNPITKWESFEKVFNDEYRRRH